MPAKSSNGNGGCLSTVIILMLLAVVAYLVYQKFRPAPLPPPIVATPTPSPIPETPTPTPEPTPTAPPEATATPEVTPTPTATPEPTPALSKLTRRQLPLQIKLLKTVAFPLIVDGRKTGIVSATAGTMVRLVKVRSDSLVDVQYREIVQSVPAEETDIFERVKSLDRYAAAAATPVAEPLSGGSGIKGDATVARKDPIPLRRGTLLQTDFDDGIGWGSLKPSAVGTIDIALSKQPSLGLVAADMIASGPISIKDAGEKDLAKLTLDFSLSASAGRPVVVRVESFGETKSRTGGLETMICPAVGDFYQHYALDLSTFKPVGAGKFDPEAAYLSFTFSVGGPDWKGVEKPEIRLDNVHYAKPAFYVSEDGDDDHDGRSENKAFATPQKALEESGPGDIILVMKGTYAAKNGTGSVASFKHSGTSSGWISLKNYPGQQPLFSAVGVWNAINIAESGMAYLEVRGLHVRGDSDEAKAKYADLIGKPSPFTNGNGISVDGRSVAEKPHHIRFANNLVEYCAGGGLGMMDADWPIVEDNVVRNNCWWMIYAGSGISYLEGYNFDGTEKTYRRLVRNNVVSGNQCFVMWEKIGKFSDGNGIIIDTGNGEREPRFTGRTLVQSNLCYNNGGSGIHSFKSDGVDIINNTAYLNSASPALQYAQIFAGYSADVRMFNNILVAPVAEKDQEPEKVNGGGKDEDVIFSHNLYFGGNVPPYMGQNDRESNPDFVSPSIDPAKADFHLKPGSPAIGTARAESFMPFLDLDGKPRGDNADKGAYQSQKNAPASALPPAK